MRPFYIILIVSTLCAAAFYWAVTRSARLDYISGEDSAARSGVIDSTDFLVIKAASLPPIARAVSCRWAEYSISITFSRDTTLQVFRNNEAIQVSPAVREWLIRRWGK